MTFRELSERLLAERNIRTPQHANRMSSIGHPCTRRLVLDRTRWQDIPPHSPETLAIFEAGNLTEWGLCQHLRECGVKITRQQEPVQLGTLWGHPEGVIEFGGETYPFEVKCLSPYIVPKIKAVEDFPELGPWYATYPAQGQCYMAAMKFDRLLWLICPRGNHLALKELWQTASPLAAEILIEKSVMINECVRTGTLPDAQWLDDHCPRCCWQTDCFGAVQTVPRTWTQKDWPDLEEKLERAAELKPAADEYKETWDGAKAMVEGMNGVVVGRWAITGKTVNRKGYTVKESEYWLPSIKPVEEAKLMKAKRAA